jgi:hypothetical protein
MKNCPYSVKGRRKEGENVEKFVKVALFIS